MPQRGGRLSSWRKMTGDGSRGAGEDPARAEFPARLGQGLPEQNLQQVADLSPLDEGMTQGEIRHHLVVVPPPLSLAEHITGFDQLREDPVGGTLGDPDRGGDVAQADSRVTGHAHQDVSVVGQKVPARSSRC